jgi:hypothetical protein
MSIENDDKNKSRDRTIALLAVLCLLLLALAMKGWEQAYKLKKDVKCLEMRIQKPKMPVALCQ